jgi:tetratricopeptide (TPR) repeat protein
VFNPGKLFALWRRTERRTPFELALRELRRGKFEDAYRRLSDLLARALPPAEQAAVHNKRGVALVSMNRKAEALQDFSAALALAPAFAPALVNVGNVFLEDGNVEEAVVQYLAALRSDEGYALAHFNLGAAYKKLGRHTDAVRELRTAARLEARARKDSELF